MVLLDDIGFTWNFRKASAVVSGVQEGVLDAQNGSGDGSRWHRLPLTHASCLGGSVFEFSHRFELVGSEVRVEAHFSKGSQASVGGVPWFGYLATRDVTFYTNAALRSSIPLGSVSITRGKCCPWVAHMTFTVPDLPTGRYWIMVCDLGCRRGVGDLAGGSIVIAHTPTEGGLFLKAEREQWRVSALEFRLDRSKAHDSQVAVSLAAAQGELGRANERLALLEEQPAEARAHSGTPASRPLVDGWVGVLIALGLLVIAALLLVRQQRSRIDPKSRSVVPDARGPLANRRRCGTVITDLDLNASGQRPTVDAASGTRLRGRGASTWATSAAIRSCSR